MMKRGQWYLILCLVVGLAVGGCTKTPDQLVQRAKERGSRGDLSGAVLDLRSAIQQDPSNGEYRFQLGLLHNTMFDAVSAEKELSRADELGVVKGGRVKVELARALVYQNNYASLLQRIEPVDAYEHEQLEVMYALRGIAFLATGKRDEASRSYDEVKRLGSKTIDAIVLSSYMSLADGDVEASNRLLAEANQKASGRLDVKLLLGSARQREGKLNEALGLYDEVLKVAPNHYQALVSRSTVLGLLRNFDLAAKDVNLLIKVYRQSPEPYIQQAFLFMLQEKPREALDSALIAMKAEPVPPKAMLLAAFAHRALGEELQAKNILSKLLSAHRNSVIVRQAFAELLIATGDPGAAFTVIEPLTRGKVRDSRTLALAGQAAALLGKYSQANAFYEAAANLSPDDKRIAIQAALVTIDSGSPDAGIEALQGALAGKSAVSSMDEILVMALLRTSKIGEARKAIMTLKSRGTPSPITENLSGLVHLAENDLEAAADDFQKALKLSPTFYPAIINLAQIEIKRRRFQEAKAILSRSLNQKDASLPVMLLLAQVFMREGSIKEEIELLTKASRLHPSSVVVWRSLVWAFYRMGDDKKALEVAERAVDASSEHPDAFALAGEAQLRAGEHSKALISLSRWVKGDPGSVAARLSLARVQASAVSVRESERTLREGLKVRPFVLDLHSALVSVMIADGRAGDALGHAKTLRSSRENAAIGYLVEGDVLRVLGRDREALAAYKQGYGIRKSSDALIRIFSTQLRLNEESDGIQDLRRWISENPSDIPIRRLLAAYFSGKGMFNEAAILFEEILQQNPSDWDGMNGLAWCYHNLKDKRALQMAESAFAQNPSSGYAADTLGMILFSTGDRRRGIELLQEAVRLAPSVPSIKFHYGFSLCQDGQLVSCRKVLSELLSEHKVFEERTAAVSMLKKLN